MRVVHFSEDEIRARAWQAIVWQLATPEARRTLERIRYRQRRRAGMPRLRLIRPTLRAAAEEVIVQPLHPHIQNLPIMAVFKLN